MTPRWTYGWAVTASNRDVPFDRGGTNKDGVLRLGEYTAVEFATEVARAMNAADTGQSYTCAYSFTTRKFTIDNGATVVVMEFTRNPTTNCAGLLGFDDTDTAEAGGVTVSTDTVGVTSSFFAGAGVHSWAPTDPVAFTSPVTAAADATTATLLQRVPVVNVNRADGGAREFIYFSTDKLLKVRMDFITTGTEQAHLERLLDWIERGRRVNYQPDVTSDNALRLALAEPGPIQVIYSFKALPHISVPELTFVQILTRT